MVIDSLVIWVNWLSEYNTNKQTQHIKPAKFNKPSKVYNFNNTSFNRKVLKPNKLHKN